MSEDRPLHVQIAEALGCSPEPPTEKWEVEAALWRCGCYDRAHADEDMDWAGTLLRYDTDWAATGPLIEKYHIHIEDAYQLQDDMAQGPHIWVASAPNLPGAIQADGSYQTIWESTPLLAICRLILALKKAGALHA